MYDLRGNWELSIIIRKETQADYKQTEHMTMRAFWNIHGPGCYEHLLVRKIRASEDYLPELSRVAEADGKIVGAIYYTRAKVVDGDKVHDIITFGPLAVEPTLQNAGIGRMLLEETIQLVKGAGYIGICIIGEPNYYPKRGFVTCDKFGITDEAGENYDALMALPLNDEAFQSVHGKLIESNVFKNCENETELNAINSEFPAYRKIKIKEGFLMILDNYFGVVEEINGENYMVRFWELLIPAKKSNEMIQNGNEPKVGDDVLFRWKNNGKSEITQICKNLM